MNWYQNCLTEIDHLPSNPVDVKEYFFGFVRNKNSLSRSHKFIKSINLHHNTTDRLCFQVTKIRQTHCKYAFISDPKELYSLGRYQSVGCRTLEPLRASFDSGAETSAGAEAGSPSLIGGSTGSVTSSSSLEEGDLWLSTTSLESESGNST